MNATIVILNPTAGGGAALDRWSAVRHEVERRVGRIRELCLPDCSALDEAVGYFFRRGGRRFVAAGGDGTVNALLNSLLRFRDHADFPQVALGAIGLGSSNDFHKQAAAGFPEQTPRRIDFENLRRQDVGCIDAHRGARGMRRHFIVNASLGITAEGNALFNRKSGVMALLKRMSTTAAISSAALSAIARHINIDVRVSFDGGVEHRARLSNLAVMKNANISGGMRAPVPVACDDGLLGVWMEEGLSRTALLKLFVRLNSGVFSPNGTSTVGSFRSARIRGEREFPVEFDGDILYADDVEFSLLPGALEVCQ